MRFLGRSSHKSAVESSSEDESRKAAVISLSTRNTPNYVATPGLEINGIRDIIPRRTDWMILLQGESQPGSRKHEDVARSAHASTPRVAPLKHSGKSTGRVIKAEDKPQKTATDNQAADRAKVKNAKASPHAQKYDEASKNKGIKIEETKADAQESAARARISADTEGLRFTPSKQQRTEREIGHDIPLDSVQDTVTGGFESQGGKERDESIPVKGKARETPVYAYDGSDEDSEDVPILPQSMSMLLKLNIRSIILLLAPTQKTREVALVANGLATITPDYSTLVADINRQLVQVLGQDFSLYLPILGCTITALLFAAYPPDPSVPSSQFKGCFPTATLDGRIFGLLSLAMTSNRLEEARRLTNHLLYQNEDFRHAFVVTVIEAALTNRDRNTTHAIAHSILALRKLSKWEETNSQAKTPIPARREEIHTTSTSVPLPSAPPTVADTHVKFSIPSPSSSSTQSGSTAGKAGKPATTPTDTDGVDAQTDSEARPITESVSSPTKRTKSGGIPPSRLPHEVALCDTLGFSGGNTFKHYSTATEKDLLIPGEKVVDVASVYTHTNLKTSSTKVWIRGPKDKEWKDVSKEYFALKKIPHPTLPGYFLSRNRTTKYERPNFIKSMKKYADAFEKREFDYTP